MCPEETNYLCSSCTFDMCSKCRQKHWFNLLTIDHDVVTYREKFNYIHRREVCAQHRNKHYRKYCEACNLPVCNHCTAHIMHKQVNLKAEYDTKRQQHRGDIHIIRNNAFFCRLDLLSDIKADIKNCQKEFSLYQLEVLRKAHRLIKYVDKAIHHVNFKHSCLNQKEQMKRHIRSIQTYEHANEQPSPLKFLFSKKNPYLPLYLHYHCALSMTKVCSKNKLKSLSEIEISWNKNRHVRNERHMKLISPPELHHSIEVAGIDSFDKISFVTPDRVWVSDRHNLILTNKSGDTLHKLGLKDFIWFICRLLPCKQWK